MPDESPEPYSVNSPSLGRKPVVSCVAMLMLLAGCIGNPPTGGGAVADPKTTVPFDFDELQSINGTYRGGNCNVNVNNLNISKYGKRGVQINGTYTYNGDSTTFGMSVTVELFKNDQQVNGDTIEQPMMQPNSTRNFSVAFAGELPRNFTRYEVEILCQ